MTTGSGSPGPARSGSIRPGPAQSGSSRPGPARSVALIHYAAPPVVGGVERVLGRHAVLMADAGHEVRVIAGRGQAPDPRVRFVRLPLLDPRHPVIGRLQAALDTGDIPRDFAEVTGTIASELRAALDGVDVAIAHNVCSLGLNLALTTALHSISASRLASPRLILWHHDLAWTSARHRALLHDGPPWDLLRTAWPGVAQVVVSAARRDDLAELTGLASDAISVVPNGVDLRHTLRLGRRTQELVERTGIIDMSPLLLMPARIMARKNMELGLRVVAAMRFAGRPAGLVVTGPVDPHHAAGNLYLHELRRLRAELGLDGVAWFLSDGEKPPGDVVVSDLYRLADVVFLPSRDEGFGLPVLEAASARLPIVCTDLPALRELAGDDATYIGPDDDPAEVAARILGRLDGDPVARLAAAVRTGYRWDTIYRERIAPLLVPVGPPA